MSYHHKNLGRFAGPLKKFTDRDGYVPEGGDSPADFNWGADGPPCGWEEFVEEATRETGRAECLLSLWRDGDRPSPGTVREVRDFLGLTQTEFGDEMGVSLRSIQYWEADGNRSPGKSDARVMKMLVGEK